MLAVLCHHKCASLWFVANVKALAEKANEHVADANPSFNPGGPQGFDEAEFLALSHGATVVVDYNATRETVAALDRLDPNFRAVHLARDPRDVLVSAYFSHLKTHPTDKWSALVEHRRKLEALSLEDGLLAEIDFTSFVFDALAKWPSDPKVLELRFESLIENPNAGFEKLSAWFGWKPSGQAVSFEDLAGRPRGTEDHGSHYRHGVPGDWRRFLTPRVAREFYARYGESLRPFLVS